MRRTTSTYFPNYPGGFGIIVILLFVSFQSCRKSSHSDQFSGDKLVLLAEITAGDSVEIPIGKTIRVGGGNLIGFQKVNDATVILTEQNSQSWILQPGWSPQVSSGAATLYTNRRRFNANTTYSIEVQQPGLGVVKASTHIPSLPKVISVDTFSEVHEGRDVLSAIITWQDNVNYDNFYIIEALKQLVKMKYHFYYRGVRYNLETEQDRNLYEQVKNTPGVNLFRDSIWQNKFLRINLFTQDNVSENYRIDNMTNPFRRIFIKDNTFNGHNYTTKVFIDRQFFIATDIMQKGRILLQVKSASEELFDYLLVYEKYKTDFGTIATNQLTSPTGNVQNGLGIFGGSSKKQHIFYFDTLE